MSAMKESHNCASTVGALAGMITSLTVCLESDVWSCRDTKKNQQFTAASVIAFLAVNGLQHFIAPALVGPLNTLVAVMPSVLFIGHELVYCPKRMEVMSSANFDRTMNLVKIVPTLLLPLAIYMCAGNTAFHDLVCGGLHQVQSVIPGGSTSSAKYVATVKQNAMNALHSAQNALNTAGGGQDYSVGDYSSPSYSYEQSYST